MPSPFINLAVMVVTGCHMIKRPAPGAAPPTRVKASQKRADCEGLSDAHTAGGGVRIGAPPDARRAARARPQAVGTSERVFELLDRTPQLAEPGTMEPMGAPEGGDINLQDVTCARAHFL